MKSWITPETIELNITSTEHSWCGKHLDGGYLGDGTISGHQTNNSDACVKEVTDIFGHTHKCSICANELPEMGS